MIGLLLVFKLEEALWVSGFFLSVNEQEIVKFKEWIKFVKVVSVNKFEEQRKKSGSIVHAFVETEREM